jgi:acetoin utilization deacetylase AcuC-like enzyme
MAIAYVLDDVFASHRAPAEHPERPERIVAVRDALRASGLPERGVALPLREATEAEIGRVHTASYVADLTRDVPGKSGWIDPDTYFCPQTWVAVLSAAGAAVDLTCAVLDGQHPRGLALVRPPGHHAEADRAMGFCLVNNVAVAAAAARDAGAARVAVLDWDVHHGNGTQHIFYEDPTVMYLSCHQWPFYPGTGAPHEIGAGPGIGTNVNVGLPAGSGDADYAAAFDQVFIPAIRDFRPELILVSAGFDAHVSDPLASMNLTTAGYRALAERMVRVADEIAGGRLVGVLEGGYDLDGLASGVVGLLDAMEGHDEAAADSSEVSPAQPSARAQKAIDATLAAHARADAKWGRAS